MVPGKIWWKNNTALIWYNLPRRCVIFINYYPECPTGLTDTNRWKPWVSSCKKQSHTKQCIEGNLGWKANNWWKILSFVRFLSKISLLGWFCGRTLWNSVSRMFQNVRKTSFATPCMENCALIDPIFTNFPTFRWNMGYNQNRESPPKKCEVSSIIALNAW